jgi:hypothetical protein
LWAASISPKTRSDSGPDADNNRGSVWTKQLSAEWHKAPAARYPKNATSKSRKHLAAYSQGLLRPPENWPIPTSDEAELAVQSAGYQLIPTSAVYSQGWPDSYFNPLRYFFDAYIFIPCN